MKERPILFSAPMVRAILEGRKTQTRRVVKPQPRDVGGLIDYRVTHAPHEYIYQWPRGQAPSQAFIHEQCRYGRVGDRLWVRETWRVGAWDEDEGQVAVDYFDGPRKDWLSDERDEDGEKFNALWLDCCDELERKGIRPNHAGQYHWEPGQSPLRWRPSIHMPRWASRINLEVTGVRVERLQEISEDDARAEGCSPVVHDDGAVDCGTRKSTFHSLWASINGAESWAVNPWVWVIEFKRVKP